MDVYFIFFLFIYWAERILMKGIRRSTFIIRTRPKPLLLVLEWNYWIVERLLHGGRVWGTRERAPSAEGDSREKHASINARGSATGPTDVRPRERCQSTYRPRIFSPSRRRLLRVPRRIRRSRPLHLPNTTMSIRVL